MILEKGEIDVKIIQVNVTYNYGSTGKIVHDLHNYLINNNCESIILYGRLDRVNFNHIYKTSTELEAKFNNLISRFSGLPYGGAYFSTNNLISKIKKEKPDVVHLHCLNGYFVNIYKLINWLKKNNIKTVLTLHAEFMHTGSCSHSLDCNQWIKGCIKCPRLKAATNSYFFDRTSYAYNKMVDAFAGFENNLTVVSVSPWLMERAKKSRILNKMDHEVIFNGVNENIFKYYPKNNIRDKFNLKKSTKIIFHATANFDLSKNSLKGGYYLNQIAKELINEDIIFLVAGPFKKDLSVSRNVILLGDLKDQYELSKYYSIADVTLLTSKRETFSMVTVESLCCGTPVVGFKAGGPETVAIGNYSKFVDFKDINKCITSLKDFMNITNKEQISRESINKYSNNLMFNNYYAIYTNNEITK